MKNKILFLIIAAVGALLITASNGFSHKSYCADPGGRDCAFCHSDKSDCIVTPPPACNDNDNDGYGNPGDSSCAYSGTDCNDSNASINPGAAENCEDGIDNNCNGKVDTQDSNAVNCPLNCTDDDGDFYSPDGGTCGQIDCADADANVNPGTYELCDDGVDNDCNDQTDCNDRACSGDPACAEESCTDYTDRGSCKADFRCSWSGKLKACTEPVVSDAQSECKEDGGRWNKKKETCTIR